MILYSLQFARGPLSRGVDESDLDWTAVVGHQFATWAGADDARLEFDAAFEYGHVHRVVEAELPELAKTAPGQAAALRVA